jgi:hypothetical protein
MLLLLLVRTIIIRGVGSMFKFRKPIVDPPQGLPKDKDGFYIDGGSHKNLLIKPLGVDYKWKDYGHGLYMGTAMTIASQVANATLW